MTSMMEKLSALEHDRWGRWQAHLHSQCARNPDGSLTIPAGYVTNLERQIATPYEQLTEEEKEHDRTEAHAVLDALQDPTDAMIDAGHQGFHQVGGKLVAPKPKVMFKAMIKAAGEEG